MTQDTALDMKDVELNEIDPEKQPMAAEEAESPVGGEKNGVVKVKLEDEDEECGARAVKFTGLSKEELLKVAGTPGWVRVRWALLILFWLGWAGMLAGAVVIIVQAPRCRPLPAMEWWNKGPLYQIGDPATFQDGSEVQDGVGDISGIQKRLDSLSTLKVKGLVIGPLHINSKDDPSGTMLKEIDQKYGTIEEFKSLLEAARKKSINLVLDLTPNYKGEDVWFTKEIKQSELITTQIKDAMHFWFEKGVGGIFISGFENIQNPGELIPELQNITANHSTEGKARVLLISANESTSDQIMSILNDTTAGILSTSYLLSKGNESDNTLGKRIRQYQESAWEENKTMWAIRPRLGHMASVVKEKLLRVYQLLLFTLQGTPLTLYGDEIGLKDLPGQPARGPYMQWDGGKNHGFSEGAMGEVNELNANFSFKAQEEDKESLLNLYKRLSDLRGKERSLLHGDFTLLHHTDKALAFARVWDQNERYVTVVNFAPEETTEVSIEHENIPEQCTVVLSSNPERKEGSSVSVKKVTLAAAEALLLKYPYSA
ncbi:amino acid transporter heavy chain SLC3A2 [Anomaloglossus baeobatrachus]|uniref:amino acid transporter heavy chain SLC3A2 n=1 Tax=Anomaloglossus baeobatrachus TaxID=238106 RepID=UPI003F50A78A